MMSLLWPECKSWRIYFQHSAQKSLVISRSSLHFPCIFSSSFDIFPKSITYNLPKTYPTHSPTLFAPWHPHHQPFPCTSDTNQFILVTEHSASTTCNRSFYKAYAEGKNALLSLSKSPSIKEELSTTYSLLKTKLNFHHTFWNIAFLMIYLFIEKKNNHFFIVFLFFCLFICFDRWWWNFITSSKGIKGSNILGS